MNEVPTRKTNAALCTKRLWCVRTRRWLITRFKVTITQFGVKTLSRNNPFKSAMLNYAVHETHFGDVWHNKQMNWEVIMCLI